MIEVIDKQLKIFRINKTKYTMIKADLYKENEIFPRNKKVKGSTLGWNIGKDFYSYWQLKKKLEAC